MEPEPEVGDVYGMRADDLSQFLFEELCMTDADTKELEDRCIDGKAFSELTREDFAIIYPGKDKFLLASKLYRLSQRIRTHHCRDLENTVNLLDELSDLASTPSSSRSSSTPSSSRSSTPFTGQKRPLLSQPPPSKRTLVEKSDDFKLPHFPPDIKVCIKKDAFYTPAQRNKLIKEGCRALRGHCWAEDRVVTNSEKKRLSKMLYELAPKSLGDKDDPSRPEAGIYTQVNKWFQNHSYNEKQSEKKCSKRGKVKATTSEDQTSDDEAAVEAHLSELTKELKRKHNQDVDKISRLLSLTFTSRRTLMMTSPANARISSSLQEYPCFRSSLYLIQEMFHDRGHRFTSLDSVKCKARLLTESWNQVIAPALVHLEEESGGPSPESAALNDVTVYCLTMIIDRLKPKKGKGKTSMDPLDAVICFAPSLDEILKTNSRNAYPYIACIGNSTAVSSAVVVCNKKVITEEIGQLVISAIIVLLSVHFTYDLAYNPASKQILEFLQEKLLGARLDSSRKTTTSYSNLYRAVSCIEQKLKEGHEDSPHNESFDDTQAFCDF